MKGLTKFWFSIGFIIMWLPVAGQITGTIESREEALLKTIDQADDLKRASIYLELADLVKSYSYRKFDQYLDKAAEILSGTKSQELTGKLIRLRGVYFHHLEDYENMIRYLDSASLFFSESPDFFLDYGERIYDLRGSIKGEQVYRWVIGLAKDQNKSNLLARAHLDMAISYTYRFERDSAALHLDSAAVIIEGLDARELEFRLEFGQIYLQYQSKDLKGAIERARKYRPQIDQIEFPEVYERFTWIIAHTHYHLGEYATAINYYKENLAFYSRIQDRRRSTSLLIHMAYCYNIIGDEAMGFKLAERSVMAYDSLGYPKGMADAYFRMYRSHLQNDRFEKALESARNVLGISRELGDSVGVANGFNAHGNVYESMQDYEEALTWYQKSWNLKKNFRQAAWVIPKYNIGNILVLLKRPTEAIPYLEESLQICIDQNIVGMRIRNLNGLASANLQLGQTGRSVSLIEEAAEKVAPTNWTSMKADTYKIQAEVYESAGRFEGAYRAHILHKQWSDSLRNTEVSKNFANMEIRFETAKKEQENELLKKDVILSEANLKSQRHINLAIIAALVVMIGGVVLVLRNNRLLNLKNKEIAGQKDEIEQSNQALDKANKEKARLFQIIAHDLRGPIGSLKSVSELVNYYIDLQDHENLKGLSKEISNSMVHVHSLLDNLLSWSLDETGQIQPKMEEFDVKTTLGHVVESVQSQIDAKNIKLKVEAGAFSWVSDPDIFKVMVRNILSNAIKFTPIEGRINISTKVTGGNLMIEISDTGTGIPEDKAAGLLEGNLNESSRGTMGEKGTGIGLTLVRKFATLIRADIILSETSQHGTKFILLFPMGVIVNS